MKNLQLKHLLTATLCCVLLTLVQLVFDRFSDISWISPRDFKTYIYWIIVLFGWIVYFADKIKTKE